MNEHRETQPDTSERLSAALARLGLLQAQVAWLCGVSEATVSLWKSGKRRPSGEHMAMLAVLLDSHDGPDR